MIVTKTTTDIYHIRGKTAKGWSTWGDVVLIFGEESVLVIAHTDFGTYGYYWSHTGPNPKKFLCEVDIHYAMNKLTSGNLYEPDPEKYEIEIKKQIIEARFQYLLTKEQARGAWIDMLDILNEHQGGDILFHELINHEHFEIVFGDYDGLPSATRVRPSCRGFWDHIWTPLTEQLSTEIKQGEEAA